MRDKHFRIRRVVLLALGCGLLQAGCRGRTPEVATPARAPTRLRLFEVLTSSGGDLSLAAYEKEQLRVGQRFTVVDDGGLLAVVEVSRVTYVECSHCANYRGVTRALRAPSRPKRGAAVAVGPLRTPLPKARIVARDPNPFVGLICTDGRRRKPILTLDLDGDSVVDLRRVAAFCPDVCYEVQARRGARWITVQRDCLPTILDHRERETPATKRPRAGGAGGQTQARWWCQRQQACPPGARLRGQLGVEIWCARPKGQRHGRYTYWWGHRFYDGQFHNGRRHGRWVFWSKNGQVRTKQRYRAGRPRQALPRWPGGKRPASCGATPYDCDGDGVPDDKDLCPSLPEDIDGFHDDDGCPEPDMSHSCLATDHCACAPTTGSSPPGAR